MSLRLHEQQGHRCTTSRDGAVEAMMEGGGWSASLDAETSIGYHALILTA